MKTQNTTNLNKKTAFIFKSIKTQTKDFRTTGDVSFEAVTARTVLSTMSNIF